MIDSYWSLLNIGYTTRIHFSKDRESSLLSSIEAEIDCSICTLSKNTTQRGNL